MTTFILRKKTEMARPPFALGCGPNNQHNTKVEVVGEQEQ
jgi:hypothetical protein